MVALRLSQAQLQMVVKAESTLDIGSIVGMCYSCV